MTSGVRRWGNSTASAPEPPVDFAVIVLLNVSNISAIWIDDSWYLFKESRRGDEVLIGGKVKGGASIYEWKKEIGRILDAYRKIYMDEADPPF